MDAYTPKVDRRTAIAWMGAVGAIAATGVVVAGCHPAEKPAAGYGTDPKLNPPGKAPWPRLLSKDELSTAAILADFILPASGAAPSASSLGVPDFIDEWVSAPYEQQERDLKVIREGIAWIEGESQKRFGKGFADAAAEQQTSILDDIVKKGTESRKQAFSFFTLFRDRAAGGYYSTPEGWKAIGYVGNVPMPEFPGPPPEVLKHLGLA